MFEGLSEHGNNSTDYPETARSPSLPKLTPLEKCESLLIVEGMDFSINGSPVSYGTYTLSDYVSGHLTGTLLEGDSLDVNFYIYDAASLVLAPEPATLPGDVNGDGLVGGADATTIIANWGMTAGATWTNGDLNADGDVDIDDYSLVQANWGNGLPPEPPEPEATPEPATLGLLLVGGLAMLRRGKRVGTV